jgi:hypothetical protein
MNAAYLFICKGVYRRIFLIVVESEEFNVVSRVEEGVQNDEGSICLLFCGPALVLVCTSVRLGGQLKRQGVLSRPARALDMLDSPSLGSGCLY